MPSISLIYEWPNFRKELSGSKKIKILFSSHSASFGGAEKCLYLLLKNLDQERFSPMVLLPSKGPLEEKIRALNIPTKIENIKWAVGIGAVNDASRRDFIKGLRKRSLKIKELAEGQNADLVFSNTVVSLDAVIGAKLSGVPHIFHSHEILSRDPELHPYVKLPFYYKQLEELSAGIVAVSNSAAEELKKFHVSASKVTVIHNGIEVPEDDFPQTKKELFGLEAERPVVCFVGWLSIRKGVLRLIDVAQKVIQQVPQAVFAVVGPSGSAAGPFMARIKETRLESVIKVLGEKESALPFIAKSDLLILPSLSDPFPLVVLEAMALRKPVVATRSGGAEEMVLHGETGYLCDVDDFSSMADFTCRLLKNPNQSKAFGTKGRERMKVLFNSERYIQQFDDLFKEILSPLHKDHVDGSTLPSVEHFEKTFGEALEGNPGPREGLIGRLKNKFTALIYGPQQTMGLMKFSYRRKLCQ